jgi:hypothetical protein
MYLYRTMVHTNTKMLFILQKKVRERHVAPIFYSALAGTVSLVLVQTYQNVDQKDLIHMVLQICNVLKTWFISLTVKPVLRGHFKKKLMHYLITLGSTVKPAYVVTCIKRSHFPWPVTENVMWIEPLLRGYLSYKAIFSWSQKWPLRFLVGFVLLNL